MSEIKIAKFELYPQEEPTSYAVGFSIDVNWRAFYRDTTVSLEESKDKTDEEIVAIWYEKLKEWIESEIERLGKKSPLVWQSFTPLQ